MWMLHPLLGDVRSVLLWLNHTNPADQSNVELLFQIIPKVLWWIRLQLVLVMLEMETIDYVLDRECCLAGIKPRDIKEYKSWYRCTQFMLLSWSKKTKLIWAMWWSGGLCSGSRWGREPVDCFHRLYDPPEFECVFSPSSLVSFNPPKKDAGLGNRALHIDLRCECECPSVTQCWEGELSTVNPATLMNISRVEKKPHENRQEYNTVPLSIDMSE